MKTIKGFDEFGNLVPRKILKLDCTVGYSQVLEYTLQDLSTIHVIQWSKHNIMQYDELPNITSKVFCMNRIEAMKYANEIANELLKDL